MSTALAPAAVTQVLKGILNDRLATSVISATVSTRSPDAIETEINQQSNRVNLFLYLVTPNLGWRNQQFPSHNTSGDRVSAPPLVLDLHYMLSAYGTENLYGEILLGQAMQLLHEYPVLHRKEIKMQLDTNNNDDLPESLASALSFSGLAEQLEQIKITPETLNTEEISRLWTAFGAKYRQSAFYKASVVLIESQKSTKSSLPVKEIKFQVPLFNQPILQKVTAQTTEGKPIIANQKILPNHQLILEGSNLNAQNFSIQLGKVFVPKEEILSIKENHLLFAVPSTLKAGIHAVQVIHQVIISDELRPLFTSNVIPFILSPTIENKELKSVQIDDLATSEPENDAVRAIQLTLNPTPSAEQKIELLLNSNAKAYRFEQRKDWKITPESLEGSVLIPIPEVENGAYFLRVRIDQAESPIDFEDSASIIDIE